MIVKPVKKSEKIEPVAKLTPPHDKDELSKGKNKFLPNQKLKLAFLPSLFHNFQSATIKHQYKSAQNGIEKQGNVSLVYSYRDDPNSDESKIWKKTNFFSISKVDVAAVVQYCAGLDADIALIMRSNYESDLIPIELYLVDLKVGKTVYHQKSYPIVYTLLEEIEAQVIKSIQALTDI